MSVEALSGKVFLIVSGASRGIGKEIAEMFGRMLEKESQMLILARNSGNLQEISEKLPNVKVDYVSVDLSCATKDQFRDIIVKSIGLGGPAKFEKAMVIHNVGSLGDLSHSANDMTDLNKWQDYFGLNVFCPAILNGVFMSVFNDSTNVQRYVINITSLCATKPVKATGYYCSGKAAREMFFKVFAEENPQVNVLNYAPGPVETDMYQTMLTEVTHRETKEMFSNIKPLTTEQTVTRLVQVLKEQKYKSGDHVDYFDEL